MDNCKHLQCHEYYDNDKQEILTHNDVLNGTKRRATQQNEREHVALKMKTHLHDFHGVIAEVPKARVKPMSNGKSQKIAQSRWKILCQTILEGSRQKSSRTNSKSQKILAADKNVSVMRHRSFDILRQTELPEASSKDSSWTECFFDAAPGFSVKIRYMKPQLSARDLIGFNNTGNICVWPSEEILSHYCIKNKEMFSSKVVCELGGGMTCLAGLMVACTSSASEVVLTDGNVLSCQNAEFVAKENQSCFGETQVNVRNLLWNDNNTYKDLKEKFDIVICADCLFFDEYRQDLVNTLTSILKPEGVAWIFAPKRGSTLQQFVEIAHAEFSTELIENYDKLVWDKHTELKSAGSNELYDENIHYPWLLTLRKRYRNVE